MSDSKAMSEREAFNEWVKTQDNGVSLFDAYLRGKKVARASLAASAGRVVDVSDGPGCVMHMPTADEIDKLRDEARRVSRAGVEWMRIEERAEVLANLADLALAGLAASAEQAECAYALIGRQLISSGLYDRMTDADSDVEAAGLISELVSVVDPILSTNAAPMTADQTDAARIRELELQVESLTKQRNETHNTAHANATLKDRAVALLRGMEWANNRWADCCPECEAAKTGPHYAGCGIGSFIAEIERLDRAEGKS